MRSALLAVAVLAGSTASSWADVEGTIAIVARDDAADLPPDLVVTVRGDVAAPPAAQLALVQVDGDIALAAYPDGVKRYAQGDETLGLVVVVEIHAAWIGNDSYVEDTDPAMFHGVYKELVAALDGLAAAGPPGSKGAIVTYGRGAQVSEDGVVALDRFTGAQIGSLKSLAGSEETGHTMRDLVAGVTEGRALLAKLDTARKVMVVVGDGVDTDHDRGLAELHELGPQLADDRVEVFAVYLESGVLESDPNGFKKLTRNVQQLDAADGLFAAVAQIVDAIDDRFYVRFPGADVKSRNAFTWDGRPHALVLRLGGDEVELDDQLVLAPTWTPSWEREPGPAAGLDPRQPQKPKKRGCGCAVGSYDLADGGLVILFVALIARRRRRRC